MLLLAQGTVAILLLSSTGNILMCNKYYWYYKSMRRSVLLVRLALHLAVYNAALACLPADVFVLWV